MTTFCSKFWKFCLNLNRTRLHKIRIPRARNNYIQFYNKNLLFISSRRTQETLNSSKNTTPFLIFVFQLQFMLKSQQKVDIKLSKICQSHQKLRPSSDAVLHMSRIGCKWGRTKDFSHLHSIRLMWSTASELGLSEWQKVASRFTEIVVKTHENAGVVSSYLSGYFSRTSWILLNKGQPTTEF